ncbi:MAG: hypothetical protein WCJ40_19580 [Planctomycetota bacterium]
MPEESGASSPVVEERKRRHHRTTTRHKVLHPGPGASLFTLTNPVVPLRSTTGYTL